MDSGKLLRKRRLMPRGRSVIVAVDHGLAAGPVRGLLDPVEVVKAAAGNGADGILITPGLLDIVADEVGDLAIIMRIDGGATTAGPPASTRVFCPVEYALRAGADAVVVDAIIGAPYEVEELEKLGQVATEGRRWGVPLLAEVLSERMLGNHLDFAGTGAEELPADIQRDVDMACRVGIELGADAIKTRYGGNAEALRRTVASSDRPIFIAGGPLRDERLESTLQLVDEVMEAGAGGVVLGRAIWQAPDPAEALRAVCAIVHEDATISEALEHAGV